MIKTNSKTICVVGLGYVGLPLALLAHEKGYSVIGLDKDQRRVDKINSGQSPFFDEEIDKNLKRSPIYATTDPKEIASASIVIICVPTPVYDNYMPNLEPVRNACETIGSHCKKGALVILESTVNPGVSENVAIPLIEKASGLKVGKEFYFAHCPERINPGDRKWNVRNIPRVVGSSEQKGLQKALIFYRSIIEAEIKPMGSLKEAEAVKIVENSFRDVNIAFVNELAQSFARLGIDIVNVIDGAATKPFAFLPHYPGCGVGGHCIPVDPYYLIEYAKQNGFHHEFLSVARRINNQMPEFTAHRMIEALNEHGRAAKGAKIALLGLSYKPEVGDTRESPSHKVIRHLERYGVEVIVFDPYLPEKSHVTSLAEALEKTEAILITTAHKLFQDITPELLQKFNINVIVDGRNCLNKDMFLQAGFTYRGVGR